LAAALLWGAGGGFVSAVAATETDDAVEPGPVVLTPHRVESKWKSLEELKPLAAKGDPAACFELGLRHLEGNGTPKNIPRALALLKEAAQGGVGNASFRLGKLYYDGTDVPVNFAQALDHYTVAARAGVSEAQHNLGVMLVSAKGVKRDYVEGLAWLILSTKSGAPVDGENRVRARLKNYPAQIRAAELRMQELAKDLPRAVVRAELVNPVVVNPEPAADGPVVKTPVITPMDKPVIAPPKIESSSMLSLPAPVRPETPVKKDQ
jgi:uncharacterized protein